MAWQKWSGIRRSYLDYPWRFSARLQADLWRTGSGHFVSSQFTGIGAVGMNMLLSETI